MSSIRIEKINLEILSSMELILSRSVDYPTSMADEIDYFNQERPQNWFIAHNTSSEQSGFIRCFSQNTDWSLAELYVEAHVEQREEVATKLIAKFFESSRISPGHRVRFDFKSSDVALNTAVEAINGNHKRQTFQYFEKQILPMDSVSPKERQESASSKELAEVLSHLHSVSELEVQIWLDEQSIRFERCGKRIASAAQVYFYPNSAEINRIATHSDFSRQGFAEKLVANICSELRARKIPKLFLKVEDIRIPAISFYKKVGFQEIAEKEQTWHSFCF